MPIYSMKNTETGEEFEITLSMAERETYLSENAHMEQVFRKTPGIVDSVRLGLRKPDASFNDVLLKAKNAHRGSTVNTR